MRKRDSANILAILLITFILICQGLALAKIQTGCLRPLASNERQDFEAVRLPLANWLSNVFYELMISISPVSATEIASKLGISEEVIQENLDALEELSLNLAGGDASSKRYLLTPQAQSARDQIYHILASINYGAPSQELADLIKKEVGAILRQQPNLTPVEKGRGGAIAAIVSAVDRIVMETPPKGQEHLFPLRPEETELWVASAHNNSKKALRYLKMLGIDVIVFDETGGLGLLPSLSDAIEYLDEEGNEDVVVTFYCDDFLNMYMKTEDELAPQLIFIKSVSVQRILPQDRNDPHKMGLRQVLNGISYFVKFMESMGEEGHIESLKTFLQKPRSISSAEPSPLLLIPRGGSVSSDILFSDNGVHAVDAYLVEGLLNALSYGNIEGVERHLRFVRERIETFVERIKRDPGSLLMDIERTKKNMKILGGIKRAVLRLEKTIEDLRRELAGELEVVVKERIIAALRNQVIEYIRAKTNPDLHGELVRFVNEGDGIFITPGSWKEDVIGATGGIGGFYSQILGNTDLMRSYPWNYSLRVSIMIATTEENPLQNIPVALVNVRTQERRVTYLRKQNAPRGYVMYVASFHNLPAGEKFKLEVEPPLLSPAPIPKPDLLREAVLYAEVSI